MGKIRELSASVTDGLAYYLKPWPSERETIEGLGYPHWMWRHVLTWIRIVGTERVQLLRGINFGGYDPINVTKYLAAKDSLLEGKLSPESMKRLNDAGVQAVHFSDFGDSTGNLEEILSVFEKAKVSPDYYRELKGKIELLRRYDHSKVDFKYSYTFYGEVHDVGFRGASEKFLTALKLKITEQPENKVIRRSAAVTLSFEGNDIGAELFEHMIKSYFKGYRVTSEYKKESIH
jgi:hypothetical protein